MDWDFYLCQTFFNFYSKKVYPWNMGYKYSPYYVHMLSLFDEIIRAIQEKKPIDEETESILEQSKDHLNADKEQLEKPKIKKGKKKSSIEETHNPKTYLGSNESERIKELIKRNITGDNLFN